MSDNKPTSQTVNNHISFNDRDIIRLQFDVDSVNKRVDRLETDTERQLQEINNKQKELSKEMKESNEKILEKLDSFSQKEYFSKGFIKAVFIVAGIVSFLIGVGVKFI